jgi:hypothetical protein
MYRQVEKTDVDLKFYTFPITNMWQVYTRRTSASDFLITFLHFQSHYLKTKTQSKRY